MKKLSLTHNNATITVRPSIGSDVWDEECVYRNLGNSIDGHPLLRINKFIIAVVRSEVTGDLGFTWPQDVTDIAHIAAAYEGWRQLPREVLKKWDEILSAVDMMPGDPDTHPIAEGKSLPPPQN